MRGMPLKKMYQALPVGGRAYIESELGREAPVTPPKVVAAGTKAPVTKAPATPPEKAAAKAAEGSSSEEAWGSWQPKPAAKPVVPMTVEPEPAAKPAVPMTVEPRLHPCSITLADVEQVRPYPDLLQLALDALQRGPCILNLGCYRDPFPPPERRFACLMPVGGLFKWDFCL